MRFVGRFHQAALGKRGMVAAAHPLAALEGIKALQEGANAVDACLVMAGVTSVVLPYMCGLGGDVFLLYYDRKQGTVTGLNSSGTAGAKANLADFVERGYPYLPQDGIFSVAVPGAPLGYEEAARRWGTWSLAKCFGAAIRIAREGFPVTPLFARYVEEQRTKLEKYEEAARIFLPGGSVPAIGSLMQEPDLARTLAEFAEGGSDYFYRGPFAARFLELNDKLGGPFTGEEFAHPTCDVYQPLKTEYRGYTVYETAPVSQGFLVLEELNILKHVAMEKLDPLGPESVHFMVEAVKLSFSDRNRYAGDPAVTGFDVGKLLNPSWAEARFKEIHPYVAQHAGSLLSSPPAGDTTSFVAVDQEGNACSFIHSNAFAFGSGLVVPGTGVLLNNRAGRSFNLVPGHPNALAPGKRPMHTLNAYLVLRGDELFLVGGTPGGDGQPQWNLQILSLILDHGASPQEAVDFPRWLSFPGTDVQNLGKPYELRMENRFPEETLTVLSRLGHNVQRLGAWEGDGGAQVIMVDHETGLLLGGSDRRVEGLALGF